MRLFIVHMMVMMEKWIMLPVIIASGINVNYCHLQSLEFDQNVTSFLSTDR